MIDARSTDDGKLICPFSDYYRSMMTKRLDVPVPPTSMPIPQSSTSPIPTTSSSFHQQRLSSSTLSPTTSMAQLSTNSPPVHTVAPQDPLKNKLSEILNEQRILQQRKEELERMVRIIETILAFSIRFPFISMTTDSRYSARMMNVRVCILLCSFVRQKIV